MKTMAGFDIDATEATAPVADEVSPSSSAKATAESWALAKGMLPQAETETDKRGVVRTKHNTEFWKFAAARAFKAWPTGAEVTEAEFDAAVSEATTQTYR